MRKKIIGDATVFCGDCFDILPKLDVTVDAVITDMPYGSTACSWDEAPPLGRLWDMLEGKTKQSANFVFFACGKFAIDLVNSKSQWYRYDMVWAKNNKVGFLNANLQPMRSHEQILVFGQPGFQKSATYVPQKSHGGRSGKRINRTAQTGAVYGYQPVPVCFSDGTLHPCSVLHFDHDRGNNQQGVALHPTQKPLGDASAVTTGQRRRRAHKPTQRAVRRKLSLKN